MLLVVGFVGVRLGGYHEKLVVFELSFVEHKWIKAFNGN